MKDAMELYNDQQTTRLELPPIAQIAALFDVFIDRNLDEQLGNDASRTWHSTLWKHSLTLFSIESNPWSRS